jgi:hypothetical protein
MSHESYIYLAEMDASRFVTQCEHGVIHITWGHATLHLRRVDFARVAQLVKVSASNNAPGRVYDGSCCVLQNEDGHFQLWIGNAGLYLPPVDFLLFADLIHTAMCRLANAQSGEEAEKMSGFSKSDAEIQTLPGSSFSVN